MSLTRTSINNPYGVIALALVVVALGLFAFFRTPTDLFPDSAPPQVAVITVQPGGSANDIADKITQIIEKELNSITGIKRIRSVSRDEVSSVIPEFYYTKSIGEAVTDVQNAVARVRARLPRDILEPMIYRITDATKPLMTLALSPREDSPKDLSIVRLLAENQIADTLLRIPGVGDVDIFGANQPEIQVRVDRDRLAAQGLTLGQVLGQLQAQNLAAPAGTVYTEAGEFLVRVLGEFKNLDQIRELPIVRTDKGRVLLRNVAEVQLTRREPRSVYIGNGREAIAINVLRPEGGETVSTIRSVKQELKRIEKRYPDILFDITNDQQPIIDINVQGMRSSVYQAVLLTILVILIFLADPRAALTVSLGIPLSFLGALAFLWFSPYTLNMVTLSGLVIAVGLVLDAAIVVMENTYRHFGKQAQPDAVTATLEGTGEVTHGIIGGMMTTVIVLVPVMFAGGYTQQIMRPLNIMIASTIAASLLVSLTVIPLVASRLIGRKDGPIVRRTKKIFSPFGRWVDRRADGIAQMARVLLRHRGLTLLGALVFFVLSMRIVAPLNGRELMPPMDTGVGIISFDTPTQFSPAQVGDVAHRVEAMVRETTEGLKWVSTTIGSEPGQISFGGGGETAQSATMMITMLDRKQREASIWEMERRWREGLRTIEGIRTFHVTEFGATPLSTTRAPLDLVISGPDTRVLDRLADEVMAALRGIKGLTDVRRSWYIDKQEQTLIVDPDLARFYGVTPFDISQTLKTAIRGIPAGQMSLDGALDIPILMQYAQTQIGELKQIGDVYIPTVKGMVPVRAMAAVHTERNAPFITRERLLNTIDVTGINSGRTIGDVGRQVAGRLKAFKLPADYRIEISGSPADMKTSAMEMGQALLVGIVLLYILLVSMFKSFTQPLVIMSSVLFSVAAGMWGLLLFHKPMCMPAMMGIILLSGTVVNNVILVIDFINERRAAGMSKDDAIIDAVRLRFRPILMTALAASIGLLPLVFEMAVGMERLSPLGIVAAVGLLAGVFVSTLLIPVIYSLMDSAGAALRRPARKATATGLIVLVSLATGGLIPGKAVAAEAAAEPQTSTNTMTLPQAVAYAIEHSPLLKMAQADAGIARGNSTSARAGLLPQVNLVGHALYSQEDHPVLSGLPPALSRFSDTTYDAGIEVKQMLWDFGQTWSRMEAARKLATAANKSLERTRDEVTFRVTALYHQRLMVDDLMNAADATRTSLQLLVDNLAKRLEAGKAARLDLLKARVKLAAVDSQLAQLEAQQVNAQSALRTAMGYDGAPIQWVPSPSAPPASISTPEQLMSDVLMQRADFQSLEALVESSLASETSARRSRWPSIMAFGQYGQYGADSAYVGSTGIPEDGWTDNYAVGLQVTFPIFDSGLRSGAITAASNRRLKSEAQREQLRLQIQQQMGTAVAELKSAQMRAAAFRQSVEEAEQALSDEQKKYDAGKSTINDLLDAEAAKLFADSQYNQALHEEQIAIVNLRLAAGKPLMMEGAEQ